MTQFVKFLVKLLVDVAVMFDVFEKRGETAWSCNHASTWLWLGDHHPVANIDSHMTAACASHYRRYVLFLR